MAELFDKDIRTINEHIGNVYLEGELAENSTIRNSGEFKKKATEKLSAILIVII